MFQELRELPHRPPALLVNDIEVMPYMIDWRTGESASLAPAEKPNSVARMSEVTSIRLALTNSAVPSGLNVGMYPIGIDDVDPSVPPETNVDCLTTGACSMRSVGDTVLADVSEVFPQSADAAVFVVTATYFAEDQGTPFANSLAWVFEATR